MSMQLVQLGYHQQATQPARRRRWCRTGRRTSCWTRCRRRAPWWPPCPSSSTPSPSPTPSWRRGPPTPTAPPPRRAADAGWLAQDRQGSAVRAAAAVCLGRWGQAAARGGGASYMCIARGGEGGGGALFGTCCSLSASPHSSPGAPLCFGDAVMGTWEQLSPFALSAQRGVPQNRFCMVWESRRVCARSCRHPRRQLPVARHYLLSFSRPAEKGKAAFSKLRIKDEDYAESCRIATCSSAPQPWFWTVLTYPVLVRAAQPCTRSVASCKLCAMGRPFVPEAL